MALIGCTAIEALGEIGKPVEIVFPPILEAVQHSDINMRQAAADALGSMGKESEDATLKDKIIPAFRTLLADDSQHVRTAAAEGLGKIGSRARSVTPALVDLLGDEDETTRYYAAEALGKIGYAHPRIEQALLAMAARDSDNANTAISALEKIGLSGEADPAAILKVLRHHEDRWVQESAGVLLYHLRPSDEYLPKVLDQLLPLLEDEDSFVRGEVADSLVAMGKTRPAVVQAVLPILESDNPTFRRLGVKIFEEIGPAARPALAKLKQVAKEDPDEEVREAATEAIEYLDRESVEPDDDED